MQDIFKTKIKYYQKQPLEVFYKEKLFLKFLQSSQKNTCWSIFSISLQALARGLI